VYPILAGDFRQVVVATVLAGIALMPAEARAGTREVVIESTPTGAAVYQLKGFRREYVGDTPLRYAFPVQSDDTVLRVSVERIGFERKTVEIEASDKQVALDLVEIPVVADPDDYDGELSGVLRDAAGLHRARDELLAALAPWSPVEPGVPVVRGDRRFLVFRLNSSSRDQRPRDASKVAERVASLLRETAPPIRIDGVLLSFERRVRGGVSTSVGTRYETEMACQGAVVPTSVWDNCATRSTTTSTSSYGTKTEYRCVGGTVTRQVYNACARRVPRQRAVVDIQTEARTDIRRDAYVAVIENNTLIPRVAGYCEFRGGTLRDSEGIATSSTVAAACGGATR
jgi:hypothetical protein